MHRGRLAARQQLFDEIRALFEGGNSIGEIARKLGLGRRRVERWVRRIDLPDRNTMASTPSNPAYFGVLLERRWAEGITKVRHLFAEIVIAAIPGLSVISRVSFHPGVAANLPSRAPGRRSSPQPMCECWIQ
jgi:hypothetical protein